MKIAATDNFPDEPPKFTFMTPNGVYEPDGTVCVSIGEYHKSSWRPVLGMHGLAENLVSGMICWDELGDGIRIIKTSVEEKKKLAAASREWNLEHFPDIVTLINNSFISYSQEWGSGTDR